MYNHIYQNVVNSILYIIVDNFTPLIEQNIEKYDSCYGFKYEEKYKEHLSDILNRRYKYTRGCRDVRFHENYGHMTTRMVGAPLFVAHSGSYVLFHSEFHVGYEVHAHILHALKDEYDIFDISVSGVLEEVCKRIKKIKLDFDGIGRLNCIFGKTDGGNTQMEYLKNAMCGLTEEEKRKMTGYLSALKFVYNVHDNSITDISIKKIMDVT